MLLFGVSFYRNRQPSKALIRTPWRPPVKPQPKRFKITSFLANAGAIITLGLGLMGLFAPSRAAALTSIQPVGLIGKSEIRATYGGLFAALGLACLLTQAPGVFLAAGLRRLLIHPW